MASTELEVMTTGSCEEVGVRGGVSALASVALDDVSVPAEDMNEVRKPEARDGLEGTAREADVVKLEVGVEASMGLNNEGAELGGAE